LAFKRKVAFKTLGCRLNQFETDAIAAQFNRHNYEVVGFTDDADVYIVNTCTVTNQGDTKSRKAINQATKKQDEPVVIVTGCMVDGQKEKLKQLNGVTYFVENAQKTSIFQLVDAHFKGETVSPDHFSKDLFGFEAADETFHTRSFIKIQDGCDNFCTFCIVPKVRGRATSRPAGDILENVREVVGFGFKEVVLTGVNIGRYHYEDDNFETLVEKILDLPGDFRVRISSIEPEGFGDKLFDLFSQPKLAPHLHLCLQSGSDRILLLMRRFYNLTTFMGMVEKVKTRYPDFNLTTDIIVGFPGETMKQFLDSSWLMEKIGFDMAYIAEYSPREGTAASKMPDNVSKKEKSRRKKKLDSILKITAEMKNKKYIGTTQTVLVDEIKSGYCYGKTRTMKDVRFKNMDKDFIGKFIDVKITKAGPWNLEGKVEG